MFLLLGAGIGLLIAWAGVTRQRGDIAKQTQRIRGIKHYWRPVSQSTCDLWIDQDRIVHEASVSTKSDWQAFYSTPDLDCSTVSRLWICSTDAFDAFKVNDFPNLKTLWLDRVELAPGMLKKLESLPKLRNLGIAETPVDPIPALRDLQAVSSLRKLILELGPEASIGSFPRLNQLKTLYLRSSDMTQDQFDLLRQRLPNGYLLRK